MSTPGRLQHIYHGRGQPFARDDFISQPGTLDLASGGRRGAQGEGGSRGGGAELIQNFPAGREPPDNKKFYQVLFDSSLT
jgi:hypothetical protein